MASDGDDVVFEGHELHKYYEKIGFQDFEIVKSPTSSEDQMHELRHTNPVIRCADLLASLFHSVWTWFKGPWVPTGEFMNINALKTHVQLIVNSGLLFEDDVQFVNNVATTSNPEELALRSVMPEYLKYLLHSVLSFSSFTYQRTTDALSSFPWYCYSLCHMTVFPVAGSVILCIVLSWNKTYKMRKREFQLKALLDIMKDLYIIFRKSLKLLEENELILRGFTLARTGSTVSRLENSHLPCMVRKWYSSPGLRVAVAEHLMQAVKTLSEATRQLVLHCPLFGQLDNPNHYLSYQDDKSIELMPVDSSAEIKLNDLKRLNQVVLLLQSEFLRRLALCFYPHLWRNNSLKQINHAVKIIVDVTDICSYLQLSLKKEYSVFYAYGCSKSCEPCIPHVEKDLVKTTDYQMAIHSTTLHLQNVLLNTRVLEEKLEAQEESREENLEEVMSHLSNIIQVLDKCKNCCEEGILQIQKQMLPRKEPEQDVKTLLQTENKNTEVKLIPVGYTDLDPQVEDEVFEAETTQDSREADSDYFDKEWTKEEKRQREMAKQLSKKMMQELKSVLVIKAKKWEEREAKAMQVKSKKSEPVANSPENEGDRCDDNFDRSSKQENVDESKDDPQLVSTESSCTLDIDSQSEVTSHSSTPKRSPRNRLLQDRHSERKFQGRSTEYPVLNTSSSSPNVHSSRSPKHVYATETFRPLQDLQFSVGLNLSNDALAKFQSRNLGTSESFSGMGEKSSSEESLSEVQKSV